MQTTHKIREKRSQKVVKIYLFLKKMQTLGMLLLLKKKNVLTKQKIDIS